MTATADIVQLTLVKTGRSLRFLFLKAYQVEKVKLSEEHFEECVLNYQNHGVIPDWVESFAIDVMREALCV